MTAVDVDALDAARAAIVKVLTETTWVTFRAGDGHLSVAQADEGDVADALLAGPLAPLLAEVRRGRALRERLEGLAEDWDRTAAIFPEYGDLSAAAARSLRDVVAATDGDQ